MAGTGLTRAHSRDLRSLHFLSPHRYSFLFHSILFVQVCLQLLFPTLTWLLTHVASICCCCLKTRFHAKDAIEQNRRLPIAVLTRYTTMTFEVIAILVCIPGHYLVLQAYGIQSSPNKDLQYYVLSTIIQLAGVVMAQTLSLFFDVHYLFRGMTTKLAQYKTHWNAIHVYAVLIVVAYLARYLFVVAIFV
jgi:hypothetical protein